MIDANWRKEVLDLAADYCKGAKIKMTTLGARIVNDADYFKHLEDGGGCTVDKLLHVRAWLKENIPANSNPPPGNGKHKRKQAP